MGPSFSSVGLPRDRRGRIAEKKTVELRGTSRRNGAETPRNGASSSGRTIDFDGIRKSGSSSQDEDGPSEIEHRHMSVGGWGLDAGKIVDDDEGEAAA